MKQEKDMTKEKNNTRTYAELMEEFKTAVPGEQCRRLHKELKKVDGCGLPLFMRYPNFPIIISIVAGVFAVIAVIVLPIIALLVTL